MKTYPDSLGKTFLQKHWSYTVSIFKPLKRQTVKLILQIQGVRSESQSGCWDWWEMKKYLELSLPEKENNNFVVKIFFYFSLLDNCKKCQYVGGINSWLMARKLNTMIYTCWDCWGNLKINWTCGNILYVGCCMWWRHWIIRHKLPVLKPTIIVSSK